MLKTKDKLLKLSYNELSKIEETDSNFNLYFEKRILMIEKDKINKIAIDYLSDLKSNYKSKQINIEEDNIWNSIDKYIENANVSCNNNINEDTINQFYNLNEEKKQIFFYNYLITIVLSFSLIDFNQHNKFSIIETIFAYFLGAFILFILDIACMNITINKYQNQALKDNNKYKYNNFKFYFYDNFLLLKTNNKIIKHKYNDIKQVLNNEKYIFIKINFLKSETNFAPLVINKNDLSKKNIEYLNKKLKI